MSKGTFGLNPNDVTSLHGKSVSAHLAPNRIRRDAPDSLQELLLRIRIHHPRRHLADVPLPLVLHIPRLDIFDRLVVFRLFARVEARIGHVLERVAERLGGSKVLGIDEECG